MSRSSDNLPLDLWSAQLRDGLREMGLSLDAVCRARLLDYLALLLKWSRAYNLTGVRDPKEMVSRHLLDSLSILPWVHGPRVLDVGTGAGLPGIPLALARPDLAFTLLDANGKKTRFVQQAVIELELNNVTVVQVRVEILEDNAGFDTITSRAFSELQRMLELSAHLRASGGQWAVMKAGLDAFDPKILVPGLQMRIERLRVPGEPGQRNLVLIGPV